MTEPKLEVPAELRDLAEKTIDQAEKAFGMFFDAAGKSMTSMPGAGTEISRQALSFTEQNMKAAFEHARKLVHATDLQEAMRIQSEFLRSQFTNAGEHMRQITGGVMSAMLGEYFLEKFPGSNIVYDARNSHSVPEVVEANGGTAVISRVGHSLIKQKMAEVDAPFGGEASGHFYFRDNWYADSGLIGAVIGLYVATLQGKKLSQIREEYTHYAAIPETNFVVDDKDAAIKRISVAFKDNEQDTLDGVTINFADKSWINVRPSNTESVLRLNAEAMTQPELDALVTKVTQLIQG